MFENISSSSLIRHVHILWPIKGWVKRCLRQYKMIDRDGTNWHKYINKRQKKISRYWWDLKGFFFLKVDSTHLFDEVVALVDVEQVHDVTLWDYVIDEDLALIHFQVGVRHNENAALIVARRSHQRSFERRQPVLKIPYRSNSHSNHM